MSDDSFDISNDPSKETNFRWQREKETHGGSANQGPPPFKEGDTLNDFVLEVLLGSGSSGFVYRALDVRTNRRCALKLLTHGSPDDLLRNKLGFRRMMSIEHPNLLRVDRIYQLGTNIALSMEEIEGVTLNAAIVNYKKLDPADAYQRLLVLMRDYASGLAMMHASGYIHRDVKPFNLMVDNDGRGQVIDYGLVDSFELDQATCGARGFLLGTPHYFAPEVIWSQRYLPAGDIFSFGIVMLDALAAIQSSSGVGPAELERSNSDQRHDAERIDEAIDGLSESVPKTIREACGEMLDRKPSDRPTAMELSRLGVSNTRAMHWPHEEPVVGRDAERREIIAWVESIFCGNVGRLHLAGPSGIGKSRLIEQVIKHIESKNWGQVFCARCRVREDQPLQAFDQICDAISHRYMKGDRERMELDPVSVELLKNIFPVLENVFTSSMQLASAGDTVDRIDALEAAVRMSEQLRLVGPLFLIIDDSQWADRDSLNVLDRLQNAVGREGLGIITVSREVDDPQRIAAEQYIHLEPLDVEDSVAILSHAADRWAIDVPTSILRELAEATGGSPFRLRELADEFRPGGALCELPEDAQYTPPFTELGQVDQLWQRRAQRLSDDAKKILTYVVTAGGRVSTQQLGELTELGDSVDAAVSELARQRLITDEATGGECIYIFHDHVADELVRTLSAEAITEAHHAWASMLSRQGNPEALAARIAGHFFAAGAPGRAVGHAILAAEDAERRAAVLEAGRWFGRVADYVDGDEKTKVLRDAARCYQKVDFPLEAADCYRQLAEVVGDEERVECQLLAITSLVRSGRFGWARDQLQRFAGSISVPRPKPAWQSKLILLGTQLLASVGGKNRLLKSVTAPTSAALEDESLVDSDPFEGNDPIVSPRLARKQWALKFCDALVRPMSLFDNLYAAKLSAAGSRLSLKYGTHSQRIRFAIVESVFACYDKGHRRIEGETNLLSLKPHVADLNCGYTTAELWSGIAYSHAFACRWDQVSQPVQASLHHYHQAGTSYGFEIAHTQWLDLWAKWNLGRWRAMHEIAEQVLDDALRRNDLLQQVLTTSGFGGSAWLATDGLDQWRRLRAANMEFDCDSHPTQVPHVFDWIASIQCLIYEGQYEEAWRRYESLESELRRLPFSRIQLVRVSREMLGALTAIHNLSHDFTNAWRLRAQVRIDQLRQERLAYATTLANFFEGLLQLCVSRHQHSSAAQESARRLLTDAKNQAYLCHLRPYQLAAEDKLAEIQTGQSLGRLEQRMEKQSVARPSRLIRLYTLPAE